MADCGKIEAAYKGLTADTSNWNDASALVEALKDVNASRVLNSDLYKQIDAKAEQMQDKGLNYLNIPTGAPGDVVVLAQRNGRPRAFQLNENGRTETVFLEIGTGLPSVDTVDVSCPIGVVHTSKVYGSSFQPERNLAKLPIGIEVESDANGKPTAIRRFP